MKRYIFSLIFLFSLFFAVPVFAADPHLTIKDAEGYSAKFVSQSIPDPIIMEAGSSKTVLVKFKNTGTETWNEKGSHYLSAYTVEPKYRASLFSNKNWLEKSQTAKIKGIVKPGAIGELSISLTAPNKTGDYSEEFALAAENASWVNKGYFFFKIKVVEAKKITTAPKTSETLVDPAPVPPAKVIEAEPYDATRILQSKKQVTAQGGDQIKLIVSFENTGAKKWKQYSLVSPELGGSLASGEPQGVFGDESWQSRRVVLEKQKLVEPHQIIKETFYFRAPKTKGEYTARFVLQADGITIPDALAELHIDVTKNAPLHYKEPKLKSDDVSPLNLYKLSEEPYIRIGVYKLENPEKDKVNFVSEESDYDVISADSTLYTIPKGEKVELSYKAGEYHLKVGKKIFDSASFLRFIPVSGPHMVFSVPNLKREIEWHKGMNFDSYRGRMEYRVTDDSKYAYVINEALLDDYVAGVSETSNGTPYEFIKAQQTAARNYAYYIMSSGEKYKNGHFDVVAHTGDQLYLGYKSEALRPRVVQATKDTRGDIITYDTDNNPATPNVVVITPYFGNSNGKTKSWTDVWGGSNKPWLVPVIADYDKRDKKKMYGHGVGMSQRDAMIRADEEKLDYKQLLKYYYTGVSIEKLFP
jgi:hypothetical protein